MEDCAFDEARRLLDQLLQEHPGNERALPFRGELELRAGAVAAAEPWLRQALAKAPANLQAADLLHRCLKQQPGRAREADEAFRRYEFLRAAYPRYLALLARTSNGQTRDSATATEIAELLLQMDPGLPVQRWLETALRADPRYLPAHRVAIAYYEKCNQQDRAEHHRRIAAQLGGSR
jgi:predicted Zn-dependent protease